METPRAGRAAIAGPVSAGRPPRLNRVFGRRRGDVGLRPQGRCARSGWLEAVKKNGEPGRDGSWGPEP